MSPRILHLILTVALATPTTALAQPKSDDTAARLFAAGEAAYARGDYRAAAHAFEAAHAREPRAAAIYNAALMWQHEGEKARAADAFSLALDRDDLDDAARANAEASLAVLRSELGWLVVSGPADARVSVGHLAEAKLPRRVHLPPGAYVVAVTFAAGASRSIPVTVERGKEQTLTIEAPLPAPSPSPPQPKPVLETPRIAPSTGRAAPPTLAWITASTALVALGTAGALTYATTSVRDDYVRGGATDAELRDRAITLRTWSWIAYGAAGLLAASTVVVYAWPKDSAVQVAVGPASIRIAMQF